jgi:hypothetical protein
MKRARDRFDAELEEIQQQLLAVGAGAPVRGGEGVLKQPDESLRPSDKRIAVARELAPTPAFQLAGYLVATLALGRSIPGTVTLQADTEYDVGRCSQSDLDIIWAVGNLAAERRRAGGSPWEPGPSITFRIVSDAADEAAIDPDQRARTILEENWDDIAQVARLLIDRRTLSRADIEAAIFEPGESKAALPPLGIAPDDGTDR